MPAAMINTRRKTRLTTGNRNIMSSADLDKIDTVQPAPDYFDAEAIEIWREISNLMINRGDLTRGDLGLLETYCAALREYKEHNRVMWREGFFVINTSGNRVQHPANYLRKGCEQQINLAGSALGLNPRSRKVVSAAKDEAAGDIEKEAVTF